MTFQETLADLLSQENGVELQSLLRKRAAALDLLVKDGHIQEFSACARLKRIYKDLIRSFNRYEEMILEDYQLMELGLDPNNISGYNGVTWRESKQRWNVTFPLNGKSRTWGRFLDFDTAVKRRLALEEKYGIPTRGPKPKS